MSQDPDWEDLKNEAGTAWARAIVRCAAKAIRDAKARAGACGHAQLEIDVRHRAITDVRRVWRESERAFPPLTSE